MGEGKSNIEFNFPGLLIQAAQESTMNLLIFPNQLFLKHPGLKLRPSRVVLIEDSLFFGDLELPDEVSQTETLATSGDDETLRVECCRKRGYSTVYRRVRSEPGIAVEIS